MPVNEDKMSLLYAEIASKSLLVALCFNIIMLMYETAPHWRLMTVAQATVTVVYVATTVVAITGNFLLGPIAGPVLSTCWLAFSIGHMLSFGFVNGLAFKAATSTSSDLNDDESQVKFASTKTELVTTEDELKSKDIHQDAAGRFEKVLTEDAQLKEKHEQTNFNTNMLGRHVSWPKLGATLALLLLAAILLPAARAEPTMTSMPAASLTLPAPTPHVTTFNTANISVDAQEKDKPQTWFYHPNSSQRTSPNPRMMLLPLIIVGYLALPSLAVEVQKKRVEKFHSTNLPARVAIAEEPWIWTTDSSTTTDAPSISGAPTLRSSTTESVARTTFMNRCGKNNCPSDMPHGSTGSRKAVLEAALLAVSAGVAFAIAFVV